MEVSLLSCRFHPVTPVANVSTSADNHDASTDPIAWTSKTEFDHLMDRGDEVDDADIELGTAASEAAFAGSPTAHQAATAPATQSDEPMNVEQRLAAAEAQPGSEALLPGGAFRAADGRVRCIWCAVQQPVRAHHCKACNMCVHGFDHHCGFLGTCIGEANRCRFWWFLTLQTLTVAVGVGVAHSCFQSFHSWTWGTWAGINAVAFLQVFLYYILLAFLGSLWGLHTWLAVTNGTTYELIRGTKGVWYLHSTKMCDVPFSRGLMRNLSEFCCVRDGLVAAVARRGWVPRDYTPPSQAQPIDRESDDVVENMWENRYYSCC